MTEEIIFPKNPILLVDDEEYLLQSFELTLNDNGINNTITISDSRKVESVLESNEITAVFLDLSMPHISGIHLLDKIKQNYPQIPVVIITGDNELETAVKCMKMGAFDYIVKPVEESKLVSSVKRAIELRDLRSENEKLKNRLINNELQNPEAFEEIITVNEKMRSIFQYMEAIANTTEPILITGETGVGKELIAKAMHKLTGRKGQFVTTNVAGLDDQMFTDTLFGHKKGAFTDANQDRPGLIEKAKGGTLFLDEIGDLSLLSQVKLLRLLQEKEYYPLGSDEPKFSDALIIAATNKNLYVLQEEGKFRKDLYYRLNVHHISLIPLRDRLDDLPVLVDYFMEQAAKLFGKKKPTYPPELIKLLSTYHFPGNIRELQAIIFNAVSIHKSGILPLKPFYESLERKQEDFDEKEIENLNKVSFSEQLPTIKELTNELIKEAMKRSGNNQSIAAKMLGITRQALNKRLLNMSGIQPSSSGKNYYFSN